MLKYIIGRKRMKEEKWWFLMLYTTKNAYPWTIFLTGQVTIIAEWICPVSNLSLWLIHAAYLCTEWITMDYYEREGGF